MAHVRIRIEEMEYRPEDKTLHILAVDEFHEIISLEISPAFPRQLAADLEFVARHPHARVVLDGDGSPGRSAPALDEADEPARHAAEPRREPSDGR